MLRSVFNLKVYLLIILLLVFLTVLIICIIDFKEAFTGLGGGMFVCLLLTFMSTFLFQEIRKSLIVISIKRTEKIIENNTITINSFLGLGKDMIYHIKEFDGFKTSSIMSKGTLYNYIFLIKNGKRVVKISDGYYSNYQEMSDFFKTNLNDLGHVDGNAFSEMIDLFKK